MTSTIYQSLVQTVEEKDVTHSSKVCQPWEVYCITLNLEHARRVLSI